MDIIEKTLDDYMNILKKDERTFKNPETEDRHKDGFYDGIFEAYKILKSNSEQPGQSS